MSPATGVNGPRVIGPDDRGAYALAQRPLTTWTTCATYAVDESQGSAGSAAGNRAGADCTGRATIRCALAHPRKVAERKLARQRRGARESTAEPRRARRRHRCLAMIPGVALPDRGQCERASGTRRRSGDIVIRTSTDGVVTGSGTCANRAAVRASTPCDPARQQVGRRTIPIFRPRIQSRCKFSDACGDTMEECARYPEGSKYRTSTTRSSSSVKSI